MTKKTHPADAAALAGIESATSFEVHLFKDGEIHREPITPPTLEAAREKAAQMAAGASRKPGVYAITAEGTAHLVPPGYKPKADPAPAGGLVAMAAAVEAGTGAVPEAAPAPRKAAKRAAAKKTAKAKKPATKARKGKTGQSKTEIAIKLLTRPQGATRKEVTEATDWPSINLKPIAKRHKLRLTEKGGVLRMVAA